MHRPCGCLGLGPQDVKAKTSQMDADLASKQSALEAQEQVGRGLGVGISGRSLCCTGHTACGLQFGAGQLFRHSLLKLRCLAACRAAQARDMAAEKADSINKRIEALSERPCRRPSLLAPPVLALLVFCWRRLPDSRLHTSRPS